VKFLGGSLRIFLSTEYPQRILTVIHKGFTPAKGVIGSTRLWAARALTSATAYSHIGIGTIMIIGSVDMFAVRGSAKHFNPLMF
jgi:hypothetical protein